MKNLFYLVMIISIVSCTSTPKNIIPDSEEEDFVLAYKKCVIFGCINEATNNKFHLFLNENNDLGLAIEVAILQHEEVSLAIENGKELSKTIEAIYYDDYDDKKPIFSNCVSMALSKDIDSIARKLYRVKKNTK